MPTILITESGGPAAIGLIKTIRQYSSDITIVATDADSLAAGLYLSDYNSIVPYAQEENYIEILLELVKKYNVDLILPTGENDLEKISKNKELFDKNGCKVFISDIDTIITCQDKFKFYQSLQNSDIPVPVTFNKPMIIKPIKGSGSRGIKKLELQDQIIQEYLPGREYTVDVFCDMKSHVITHVIRQRLEIKAGISTKGRIVQNNEISDVVFKLVKHLKLKGPICIQFKENETGSPVVIECNPRLGGATFMCTLAGINYAELYFNIYNNNDTIIEQEGQKPKNITVVRYLEEIIV